MDEFEYQWPYTFLAQSWKTGIDGLNTSSIEPTQIEATSKTLEVCAAQRSQRIAVICDYCAGTHPSNQCTINLGTVQYGGNTLNQYAYDNYDQVWGYHPDSSWSYNYQDQYSIPDPTYTPDFSYQPPLKEENSRFDESFFKYVEEELSNQTRSIQNIQNMLDQLTKAVSNLPQNNWCYDEDSEIDEVPEPNLRLDEPQDIESVEIIGYNEIEIGEDLTLSTNEDEPISLVSHVPSPPKFKNPVRFAKSCPLGSNVVGEALVDIRMSTIFNPWWDEKEKIDEEPIVFDTLPCPNMLTNTMEIAPSYLPFFMEIIPNQSLLGDFNAMGITNGNRPKAILFPMDGGFLNFRRGIG